MISISKVADYYNHVSIRLPTAQLIMSHSGLDTRLSSSRATDMVFLKILEVLVNTIYFLETF